MKIKRKNIYTKNLPTSNFWCFKFYGLPRPAKIFENIPNCSTLKSHCNSFSALLVTLSQFDFKGNLTHDKYMQISIATSSEWHDSSEHLQGEQTIQPSLSLSFSLTPPLSLFFSFSANYGTNSNKCTSGRLPKTTTSKSLPPSVSEHTHHIELA